MTVWLVLKKEPAMYGAGWHSYVVEVCRTKELAEGYVEAALRQDNTDYYETEEWEVVG